MRLSLATKVTCTVAAALCLVVVISGVALLSAWRIGRLMEYVLSENMPSIRAAEQLDSALLEQRGFISFYVLDGGNQVWLQELTRRLPEFEKSLARARESARTPEEIRLLDKLDVTYASYDRTRTKVVALYDRGEVELAKTTLLVDLRPHQEQLHGLCEEYSALNHRIIDAASLEERYQVKRMTTVVGASTALAIGVVATLAWLFFSGLFLPLRRMAAEARCVAGPGDADIVTRGEDEVGTVGNYLRALTSDVIQARSKLEHSRIQLTRAEKLAAVGELAASVAHEIRNPLTSIKLWLYSIRQSVADNSEVDSRCALVSDEVTRLDRIIGNFLEFSRPPEVHVRQCGISTLLEKTMELFTPRMQQSRIKCSCEIKPGLPQVMADPCQLRQVVGNLLANAVDAMPGGGSLRISADAEKDQGKDAVIVRVADTGPGIPECAITRIFDPFFSTKPHGTGLGLAIATRIMEQHHGRLTIESSTGDGTTFAISIPTAGVNGSE